MSKPPAEDGEEEGPERLSPEDDPAALVDRLCAEAGMDGPADKPLRLALVTTVRTAVELRRVAETIGKQAASKAAQAAAAEMRGQLARLATGISRTKLAASAAALLLAVLLGYALGRSQPVETAMGPLTPAQAETLRYNDFGAALDACTPQPPRNGREWCSLGWWKSKPAPPR